MNIKEIIGSVFSITIKVILIAIAIMALSRYVKEAYTIGYRVFTEPAVGTGEGRIVHFTIGNTSSVYKVGQKLEEVGLIRDPKVFFLQELASESHGMMKPGKYDLNTNMTAEEIIKVMAGTELEQDDDDLLYNTDEEVIGSDATDEELMGIDLETLAVGESEGIID